MRTTVATAAAAAAIRPSDFGPLHGLASAGRRDSNACVYYTLCIYNGCTAYSKCIFSYHCFRDRSETHGNNILSEYID